MSTVDDGSPIKELLGDSNFRNFWIAQTLTFGLNGTVRSRLFGSW